MYAINKLITLVNKNNIANIPIKSETNGLPGSGFHVNDMPSSVTK